MNFLVITDDEQFSNQICQTIRGKESSAKISTSDFDAKNIKKVKKHIEDLSLLLIYKSNSNLSDFTENSLLTVSMFAAYAGAKEVLILTNIEKISDANILPKDSVVYLSKRHEMISYIKKQYQTISDVNAKRLAKKKLLNKGIPFTPDCFASYIAKNKTQICNLFIQGGINLNSRDENGTPMLNIAVRNDNEAFVTKLIELGADINIVSEDRGYTPVMDAVWRKNVEITEYLIKSGADLNTINKEGQTNLVLAVGSEAEKICELLAKNGADPDIKDQMGMSAYGYASLFHKEKLISILKPYHKE
ncbi:MAG: ankyrin repeat domain-containing protein [Treponema sp.]|nr:ankyrin repeat domain-containing protein [Treponema sp.]